MNKHLRFSLTVALFCFGLFGLRADAQQHHWAIYPSTGMNTSSGVRFSISQQMFNTTTPANRSSAGEGVFTTSGTLLFSTANHGLYNASGTAFATVAFNEAWISDVVTLPVKDECNRYAVVHWYTRRVYGSYYETGIRVHIVDAPPGGTLTYQGYTNYVPTTSPYAGPTAVYAYSGYGIAAAPTDFETGNRYIYTMWLNQLRRWVLNSDGTLSEDNAAFTPRDFDYDVATEDRGENMEVGPDGTFLAFKSHYRRSTSTQDYHLVVHDLAANSTTSFAAPSEIVGFEYDPNTGSWFVTRRNYTTPTASLGYFDASNSYAYTAISSSRWYGFSSVELALNGNMYVVNNPSSSTYTTGNGQLFTFNPSSPSDPTAVGSPVVQVWPDRNWSYRLPKQIDGENYSAWHNPANLTIPNYFINGQQGGQNYDYFGNIAVTGSSVVNAYSCGAATLQIGPHSDGNQYVIDLFPANSAGTRTSSTVLQSATITVVDVDPFPGPDPINLITALPHLGSNTGYFILRIRPKTSCPAPSEPNGYSYTWLLNQGSLPANAADFKWADQGVIRTTASLTCPSPYTTGAALSIGLSGNSTTGYVDWFYLVIDKITGTNCPPTTLTNVSNGSTNVTPVYGVTTSINPVFSAYLPSHPPTGSSVGNSSSYFLSQANVKFKVTLVVGNACTNSSKIGYFRMSSAPGSYRMANPNGSNDDENGETFFEAIDYDVYPNPASTTVNILRGVGNESETVTAKVFDVTGKFISSWQVEFGENSFSTESFTPGLYTIRFETANGGTVVKRFVKQ